MSTTGAPARAIPARRRCGLGLRRGLPVLCAGDRRPVGRVAGQLDGGDGGQLLVESGWWDPVVRRVPLDRVARADQRVVMLTLDRREFRRLPLYLPDPELELAVYASISGSEALRYIVTRFVEIAASDGVITASGNLATEAHRVAVLRCIETTPAVLGVRDALATDEEIVVTIALAMVDHRPLQPSRVRIASRYGRVTLEGDLDSRRDVDLAVAVAGAAPGVASVENRLRVKAARRSIAVPRASGRLVLIEPTTLPPLLEFPEDPHLRRILPPTR